MIWRATTLNHTDRATFFEVWLRLLVTLVAVVCLSGCAIQLAPDYDAQLQEGLIAANKDALTLFAKVESGSTKAEFATLSGDYANVIASFEALRQRADSRQIPPLASRLTKMKFFAEFCDQHNDPNSCLNATSSSLTALVATLRRLRDDHRGVNGGAGGLSEEHVAHLRSSYDQKIHQALTVETALKR